MPRQICGANLVAGKSLFLRMDHKNKIEGLIEVLAAIFVMFSAMINPETSALIAALALAAFGFYRIFKK